MGNQTTDTHVAVILSLIASAAMSATVTYFYTESLSREIDRVNGNASEASISARRADQAADRIGGEIATVESRVAGCETILTGLGAKLDGMRQELDAMQTQMRIMALRQ